jgi:hypothetical protein
MRATVGPDEAILPRTPQKVTSMVNLLERLNFEERKEQTPGQR